MKEVEIIKRKEEYDFSKANLPKQKLKVAAYARVSTDMEEQQTSFISQQKYYLEKITSNPNWIFVEVYADEGISGTQAIKRENFMRMIKDAKEGKIDLILTKSISRFARNTLDTLKYVRELKANGVAVLFEEENINTLDMAGELLLTVLSSVAQQESETISSHIKLGLKMKRERGELVGFSSCYGLRYDSKKHKMTIIEEEAKVIRFIFEKYLKGYGTNSIAVMLENMKIVAPGGGTKWVPCTINSILKNEKYMGDVIQGKTFTIDSITHKRVINNGEEDKYYIKNHHEAIVDKETFEEAQQIMNSRSITIMTGRKRTRVESFTGRMRCGFCGNSYVRRVGKNIHWNCSTCVKGNKISCPDSRQIPNETIKSVFMECFYLLTKNDGLAIDDFIKTIKETIKSDTPTIMKAKYEENRKKAKQKLNKLIDLYVDGEIDRELYNKKQKAMEEQIEDLSAKIETIEKISNKDQNIDKTIEKIRNDLRARECYNSIQEFDINVFDSLVDYIIIGGNDENDTPNSFLIRFISKNGIYNKARQDITENVIISNGLNASESIYIPILDFISNQKFCIFEWIGGRRAKKIVEKVRVRLELEK